MSPEHLKAVTALLALLSKIGVMPFFYGFATIILLPWAVLVFLSMNHYKRFEAVVKMYENNFAQVEEVMAMADGYKEMASKYHEALVWSTQRVTEANEIAENNMHCPIVRKQANPKDIG